MQQSVRNVCAKFKVDRLSRFCTGARPVLTAEKLFTSEIPLTMKLQHQILFKQIFWSNYHLSNFFWNLWRQTNRYANKEINIWTPTVCPFFHFIFLLKWNKEEIFTRRHEKDQKQSPQSANLLKKRPCRCFLVNFANFLRTPFLTEHLQWLLLKDGKL